LPVQALKSKESEITVTNDEKRPGRLDGRGNPLPKKETVDPEIGGRASKTKKKSLRKNRTGMEKSQGQ